MRSELVPLDSFPRIESGAQWRTVTKEAVRLRATLPTRNDGCLSLVPVAFYFSLKRFPLAGTFEIVPRWEIELKTSARRVFRIEDDGPAPRRPHTTPPPIDPRRTRPARYHLRPRRLHGLMFRPAQPLLFYVFPLGSVPRKICTLLLLLWSVTLPGNAP